MPHRREERGERVRERREERGKMREERGDRREGERVKFFKKGNSSLEETSSMKKKIYIIFKKLSNFLKKIWN